MTIALKELQIVSELKKHFGKKEAFHISEIIDFFRLYEKTVKRPTVEWRVHNLVNKRILQRIDRGWYALERRSLFEPVVSESLKKTYELIIKNYPYIQLCVWDTRWINEFMIHQPGRFFQVVETDQEATEAVFYFLKEQDRDVYIKPSTEILNRYMLGQNEAIVLKDLVSEAPLQKFENVFTATLEKILVDIFCDAELFGGFQGAELINIFSSAMEKYIVQPSRMLRYAGRRGKRREIAAYIEQLPKNRQ